MRFFFYLIFVSALLTGGELAWCDSFIANGVSARTLAAGGAWLPSSTNATDAMAVNPAGLALLSGPTLDLGLTGAFARGSFRNGANPNGRLDSNGLIPYGAFGTPLGSSRFSFGASILPMLASSANWRYTDTPGGAGGISYGPLAQKSDLIVLRTAAGIGMRLGSRVEIGATLGAVYNGNTLETAYVFQNYAPLAGAKTLLDLNTHGVGWNSTVGIYARASKRLTLGAVYRSQTTVQSKGVATGNAGVQFAAIGLGAARPDFRYDAEVDNRFPRSIGVNTAWQANRRLQLVAQVDWINWSGAFVNLPVILTRGSNADINGLLGSTEIRDSIPLAWRDQVVERFGLERKWLENAVIRAGYAHGNAPVPGATLSPLTAAITRNTLSGGFGYRRGRYQFDAAYGIDPSAQQSVGQSSLKSSEYSNSRIRVGIQTLVLTTSIRL